MVYIRMRYLNEIELFLMEPYSIESQKGFIGKTRCICNYVERGLRSIDFESDRSRLNINCTLDENLIGVIPYKKTPFLEVRIFYEIPDLSNLKPNSFFEHCAEIIRIGLDSASEYMPVPSSFVSRQLKKFKSEGYKNTWIHKEKEWVSGSLKSIVRASLELDGLYLWQEIMQENTLIAKKLIAQESPREALFHRVLGDLFLDRSGFIMYKTKRKVISKFDIANRIFVHT